MPTTFSHSHLIVQEDVHLQNDSARRVYFDLFDGLLFDGLASFEEREAAVDFLCDQLAHAATIEADLPHDMNDLEAWMHSSVEKVGQQYHEYLEHRKAGGARRYFSNKSHALYFIKSVAPTKMVDGAWLYGVLERWHEPRFLPLIRTYLEELGEGSPAQNHVVLYKKLLASQGCERWDDLSDEHYVQGAIQLALGYHADRFLPEVIGFNLGYEQLPLHLLISAYELKELGIDPYYFTLHITVDNADSGHAKQAVDAVFDAMPRVGDTRDFWRRVRNGYKLNLLGASTNSVITEFNIEREMNTIFARKGEIGKYAHSDYRQVAGRGVNDWLADSARMSEFTRAMEQEGWFKRGQDPKNSRFWKLIYSEKAKMFGVFSTYEQQVIYDWIAADADRSNFDPKAAPTRVRLSSESKAALLKNAEQDVENNTDVTTDFDAELHALEKDLAQASTQQETMSRLIALMSPALHHSTAGLKATRIFNKILG